jgi:hypothetical protein
VNARLTTMLSGALFLLGAGAANAESLATGCLAKNGSIYGLGMYSNNPRAPCRRGEEIIRLAVHQPDTKFSKQRATVPFEGGQQMASFQTAEDDGVFGDVLVELRFMSCANRL